MPQLERDGLTVSTVGEYIEVLEGGRGIGLDLNEARWLMSTALPAMINALTGTEEVSDAVREGYQGVREG